MANQIRHTWHVSTGSALDPAVMLEAIKPLVSHDVVLQICLAAEKCGSLAFDVHKDVWYSSEGFLCDVTQTGHVTYWSLLKKVSAHDRL